MATMASSGAPPSGGAAAAVPATGILDKPPLKGSWIAELEDAKAALSAALRSDHGDDAKDVDDDPNAVLLAYLRLCRAYKMLRRWDRLVIVSKLGMKACESSISSCAANHCSRGRTATSTTTLSLAVPPLSAEGFVTPEVAAGVFREYRGLATAKNDDEEFSRFQEKFRRRVLTVKKGLGPDEMAVVFMGGLHYANATAMQEAVLLRNVRHMEVRVALGATVDLPFPASQGPGLLLPTGATVLVMACTLLVDCITMNPKDLLSQDPDKLAECAIQLVHLGADPNSVMPHDLDPALWGLKRFEGKSAFQIAAMSKRRPLAALLWEHMQMSPEERAEVVHCRCGSRLPWKQCHSTGPGQLPHYVLDAASGQTYYRVSPLAKCPCRCTNKTYYTCCWSDNRVPVYQNDVTGELLCRRADSLNLPSLGRRLRQLAAQFPAVASVLRTYEQGNGASWIWPCARLFRKHKSLFEALCEDVGPKSRMTKWDPYVYAGCVERLKEPFLWRDVHWDLDHSILLRYSEEWNDALRKYCDEVGLVGAKRDSVVDVHTAHVCGPCGFVGCGAVESEIREFLRCAGCRAVAYCSKECQKADWAEHHKFACPASPDAPFASSELVLYEGTAPINLGQD